MDSSLPHSDNPAFLLSPSQPRQAPPALHKSCGLKDRSLSESWTATHFSLPIQGISPGPPPPPLSQHFLSALLPALPPPREETLRPTVGSQALLHPPSTPWPGPPLLSQKPQHRPVPCIPPTMCSCLETPSSPTAQHQGPAHRHKHRSLHLTRAFGVLCVPCSGQSLAGSKSPLPWPPR